MKKIQKFTENCVKEALRLDYLAGELSATDVARRLNCSEEEALERIGVTELRRTLAYSTEEIEAMYQRNENFNRKRADFDKLRLFQDIKADLTEFLQRCGDVQRLEEIKPNQYEKNAVLFLDMNTLSTLNREETVMLAAIMGKADRMVVSAHTGGCIRLSFCVENVWID